LRQAACNDFEKDLLMNNACFGKTMENVRDRKNIELVSNGCKFLKLIAKPHLETFKILNENTVLVDRLKTSALLDKPIYAGFCILELSKVVIHDFHYNVIVDKYGDKARLLFTDTDSLCYCIETDDVYADMKPLRDKVFDFSKYPVTHPLYSVKNKKVPGFMKDESKSVLIKSFVALRSKMYSILRADSKSSKMTAKGVKRGFCDETCKTRYVHENSE